MHNSASVLENDAHKLQWDFDKQTGSSYFSQKTKPNNNQQKKEKKKKKKKRTCRILDFAVLVDHRIKLKESERRINTRTS